jgi:hypothetical protein
MLVSGGESRAHTAVMTGLASRRYHRYVQASAACHRNAVHGRVIAVPITDDHRPF